MIDFQVFNNIQKYISLSVSEIQHLKSSIIHKEVGKKEIVLRQGQSCRNIYFVESGSLRAFHINDEGKESTIMFGVKDWWITDMNCFINQKPASLTIQALEDSEIIALDFQSLEQLYQDIPKLEKVFRILFQKAYVREQQRTLQNISLSTAERYKQFVETYPAIIQKATQKQIASYLGVTPEFLSSLKRKMLKLS